MRRALLVAALALASACGAPAPAEVPSRRAEPTASWADVFEGTPDLYAVVRPAAIKRDGVYGAFWSSLMRAAEARGLGRGSTMIEAADGAESIVLGLARPTGAGGDDAELVLTGVPANLDPLKMSDDRGRPLFRLSSDRAKIPEYQLAERAGAGGSLFVLPDRTWVGALGEARTRARQAFANPLGRPPPKADPDALATVRVGGPLAHVLDRHPRFGPLERRLVSATFSLMPAKRGAVVLLAYEDADAAAWGEQHARRLAAELAGSEVGNLKAFSWLKTAKIHYEVNTVRIELDVPPRLLEELPNVTGGDLFP